MAPAMESWGWRRWSRCAPRCRRTTSPSSTRWANPSGGTRSWTAYQTASSQTALSTSMPGNYLGWASSSKSTPPDNTSDQKTRTFSTEPRWADQYLAAAARRLLGREQHFHDVSTPNWRHTQFLCAVDGADEIRELFRERLFALELDRRVRTVLVHGERVRIGVEPQHAVRAGDLDLAPIDAARPVAGVDDGRVLAIAQLEEGHVGIIGREIVEGRADPGAHRLHFTIEYPAGAIDHVGAVHQPHAATGGTIEKPR